MGKQTTDRSGRLKSAVEWFRVEDSLPPLDETVILCVRVGTNVPMLCWGIRRDEDDGWLWCVPENFMTFVDPMNEKNNDYICEDDYDVTHWAYMLDLPEDFKNDRSV